MPDNKLVCDAIWWSEQTKDEKDYWLNWAAQSGATGEPNLVERNPDYPDLMCMTYIDLGIDEEEIDELFFDEPVGLFNLLNDEQKQAALNFECDGMQLGRKD